MNWDAVTKAAAPGGEPPPLYDTGTVSSNVCPSPSQSEPESPPSLSPGSQVEYSTLTPNQFKSSSLLSRLNIIDSPGRPAT